MKSTKNVKVFANFMSPIQGPPTYCTRLWPLEQRRGFVRDLFRSCW